MNWKSSSFLLLLKVVTTFAITCQEFEFENVDCKEDDSGIISLYISKYYNDL